MMGVTNLLIDLGIARPAQKPYSASIELREHQTYERLIPASYDDATFSQIFAAFDAAVKQGLVELEMALARAGGFHLKLRTASMVGHSVVSDNDKRIFLAVRPKVPAARILQLALAAENLPSWKSDLTTGADADESTIEWTITAFVAAVQDLLSMGGIRSSHERVKGELQARVRGRLLTVPYVKNVALGKPDKVPCEFGALHMDNAANRLIRWSLHVCALIARELPMAERTLIKLRRLDLAFSDVPLTIIPARDLANVMSLPAGFRHYKAALSWAQVILRRFSLDARMGSYSAPSVSLDMNKLYEAAFYNLLKKHAPSAERQVNWPVNFTTNDESVSRRVFYKPDVFIPASSGRSAVVLDTKWKRTKPKPLDGAPDEVAFAAQGTQLVPIHTGDLYQLTSYVLEAMVKEGGRCVGMLVYPTLGKVDTWTRNVAIGPEVVAIHLVGWDVSAEPQDGVEKVWQHIDSTREISAPS